MRRSRERKGVLFHTAYAKAWTALTDFLIFFKFYLGIIDIVIV